MSSAAAVRDVLSANATVLQRARLLNARAGDHIFSVMDRSELITWVKARIGDAISVEEITSPDDLRLPALNAVLVAQVETANPDAITVNGQQYAIWYPNDLSDPVIGFLQALTPDEVVAFPEHGAVLPSGRRVVLRVMLDGKTTVTVRTPADYRQQMAAHDEERLWANWPKPELEAVDPRDHSAEIPSIRVEVYASGQVGYGVLSPVVTAAAAPWFTTKWTRDLDEAQQALRAAQHFLRVKRDELALQDARRTLQERVTVLCETLRGMYRSISFEDVSIELREKLVRYQLAYPRFTEAELVEQQRELEAVLQQMQAHPVIAERVTKYQSNVRAATEARQLYNKYAPELKPDHPHVRRLASFFQRPHEQGDLGEKIEQLKPRLEQAAQDRVDRAARKAQKQQEDAAKTELARVYAVVFEAIGRENGVIAKQALGLAEDLIRLVEDTDLACMGLEGEVEQWTAWHQLSDKQSALKSAFTGLLQTGYGRYLLNLKEDSSFMPIVLGALAYLKFKTSGN